MGVLAQLGVELLDVEQVVIRGRLTLGVLVAAVPDVEDLTDCVDEAMAAAGLIAGGVAVRTLRLKSRINFSLFLRLQVSDSPNGLARLSR